MSLLSAFVYNLLATAVISAFSWSVSHPPTVRTTFLVSLLNWKMSAQQAFSVDYPPPILEEVLGLMKDADWIHFACHGIQDPARPTFANKRHLKISDITGSSRSRGGSACQTATGDEDLFNEAIDIVAGMLFAGYGGAIGTMWSIE